MGTTRFGRPSDNRLLSPNTIILNGSGGGAPALIQDPLFPMSNLLNPDRYTPWKTLVGATPPLKIDFDLLGSLTCSYISFHGLRQNAPLLTGWTIERQTGTYTPGGTWLSVSGSNIQPYTRDQGFAFAAVASRLWRLTLTTFPQEGMSFGSIFLGTLSQDLGILYSAMVEDIIHATIPWATASGHANVMEIGDTRSLVQMSFRDITDAIRQKIDNGFGRGSSRDPVVWVDRADIARQVIVRRLVWTHTWGSPNLWDCQLDLEVLG